MTGKHEPPNQFRGDLGRQCREKRMTPPINFVGISAGSAEEQRS